MKTAPNRVLLAFKAWEDRKKEMEPLVKSGAADERTLRQLQLDHLRQARHRLRKTARPDEQPFMALLNNQVSKLEKQLYSNLWVRLFLRLKDRLFDGPAYLKKMEQQRAENIGQLRAQLETKGFDYVGTKLEKHLPAEQPKVELPLTLRINEEKELRYGLQFEKDPYGNFQLDKIACSIHQNGNLARTNVIEVNEWPGIKANQLYHLLEGRPVRHTYQDALGRENSNWVTFGENGLQQFKGSDSFHVRKLLEDMPAIKTNKEELTHYLEQGQLVNARWKQEKYYQDIFIKADPANRTLQLLDSQSRPVTPVQLNERAKARIAAQKREQPESNARQMIKSGPRI